MTNPIKFAPGLKVGLNSTRFAATSALHHQCNQHHRVNILTQCHPRQLHTSRALAARKISLDTPKEDFETMKFANKWGQFEHHKLPKPLLEHEFDYPICRDTLGIRWPGYWFKRKFVYVQEMEPELVVPDLDGFELKPYVSYRAQHVDSNPFTAKDLFNAVYADQIKSHFEKNPNYDATVSQEDIDVARLKAMQTGADLFEDGTLDGVRAPTAYRGEAGE